MARQFLGVRVDRDPPPAQPDHGDALSGSRDRLGHDRPGLERREGPRIQGKRGPGACGESDPIASGDHVHS